MATPAQVGLALTLAGLALELGYFFFYMPSVPWGPPGTENYVGYERANRLNALPLLILIAGTATRAMAMRTSRGAWVLLAGALLMLAGSISEFWIFSTQSYESTARLAAWLTFLVGGAAVVIGLSVMGLVWFVRRIPEDPPAGRH